MQEGRPFANHSIMAITVRNASEEDLPQIQEIFEHYVLNTIVSFLVQKPPPNYIVSRFRETTARNLPYLVALDDSDQVVGYSYASAFRGFMLGYGHTVEISLFCHPQHTKKGVGSQMMKRLIALLRCAKHVTREVGHEDSPQEHDVKKVMAIMSVDQNAAGGGLAVRDWYKRWGFEEVGRLKGVGSKKGTT
jgi:phosphinothricin acetyltransferase